MVSMPGKWTWDSSVTNCGNRNVAIAGEGPGITMVVTSVPTIMLDYAGTTGQRVSLTGMTILSSSSSGTSTVLRAVYSPHVASSTQGSVTMSDLQVTSGGTGATAATFCKVAKLDGAWQSRFTNILFNGRFATPGDAGCAMVDISESFDTLIDKSQQVYGDALVYQSGYAEGIVITGGTAVIGTNWVYTQAASGIVKRSNFSMLGLWLSHLEASTQQGGLKLADVKGVLPSAVSWTQWGPLPAGSTWVGYDLTDAVSVNSTGDVFVGSPYPADVTAIKLQRSGGTAAANNTWVAPTMEGGVGTGVNFGANTTLNVVLGMRIQPGLTGIIDAGTGNIITSRRPSGAMATQGNTDILGAGGQVLLGIGNLPDAINRVRVNPNIGNLPPYLSFEGQDPNLKIQATFLAQGNTGCVVNNSMGTVFVCDVQGAGAQVNYPIVKSATSGNAVFYTGNSGANIAYGTQGGGVALFFNIPLCSTAPAGALCSASGSGSAVSVK